ncbi:MULTISPECIES: CorA family divalent cation transporter [Lactiplantibacillus]|uniref:CorA family divalent cation transporter n=1 Tax=Lactiplantibacillus TaxID=2767842 RepID=UPI0020A7153F|nr:MULTISPECIES: CorA family divalent cation transporter [Lactiplantibacillus]
MLQYFATGKNGLLTTPDHQQDTSYWINVERPTIDEIDQLVDQFDLPRDYLTAVLDDAEVSRTEQLSATDDDQPVLIVMQYPQVNDERFRLLRISSLSICIDFSRPSRAHRQ